MLTFTYKLKQFFKKERNKTTLSWHASPVNKNPCPCVFAPLCVDLPEEVVFMGCLQSVISSPQPLAMLGK